MLHNKQQHVNCLERVVGNDPTFPSWQPGVIPLYDTRKSWSGRPDSNWRHRTWKDRALPTELLPHLFFDNDSMRNKCCQPAIYGGVTG